MDPNLPDMSIGGTTASRTTLGGADTIDNRLVPSNNQSQSIVDVVMDEAEFAGDDGSKDVIPAGSAILTQSEDHGTGVLGPFPDFFLRTGFGYDGGMILHTTVLSDDDHPEDPRRIEVIYQTLCRAGLLEKTIDMTPRAGDILLRIAARPATPEEICLVHTPEHLQNIQATSGKLWRSSLEYRGSCRFA